MMCYCMLRNCVDILACGHTAYFNRFGVNFPGTLIPFGAEINYKPASPKDLKRMPTFGTRVLPGLFVGYQQQAGGGWSGDVLVADWEEIANAESQSDIHIRRVAMKEIEVVKKGDRFRYPAATGELKQPGNESLEGIVGREARRRKAIEEEEEAEGLIPLEGEEDEELELPDDDDPFEETEELDEWSFSGDTLIRIHRSPRKSLFKPDRADMPVPQRFLDIMRTTETDLSDHSESKVRDYWTGTERKELSEPWKGRTIFFIRRPKPPSGYTWVNGRLVKMQTTTRPGDILPELWFNMSQKEKKAAIEEWKIEGPKRVAERAEHGNMAFPNSSLKQTWMSSGKPLKMPELNMRCHMLQQCP